MASSHFEESATSPDAGCLYLQIMKIKSLLMISALALPLQMSPFAFGQNPDQSENGQDAQWEKRLTNLSSPERQKLNAAHQKAMEDPSVQAARQKIREAQREFREAIRAAMLKADPSVQPILEKLPKHHRRGS
jgi:hypothetical protein